MYVIIIIYYLFTVCLYVFICRLCLMFMSCFAMFIDQRENLTATRISRALKKNGFRLIEHAFAATACLGCPLPFPALRTSLSAKQMYTKLQPQSKHSKRVRMASWTPQRANNKCVQHLGVDHHKIRNICPTLSNPFILLYIYVVFMCK